MVETDLLNPAPILAAKRPAISFAAAATGVDKAAAEFEAVFLRLLLKEMMPRDGQGFFGQGPGADVYKDLFVGSIADRMAERGVLGIRPFLEKGLPNAGGSAGTSQDGQDRVPATGKEEREA